jgi:hypothetical protein
MYASYLLGRIAILTFKRRGHASAREAKMTLFCSIPFVITQLWEMRHASLTTQTIRNKEIYNTKVQKR